MSHIFRFKIHFFNKYKSVFKVIGIIILKLLKYGIILILLFIVLYYFNITVAHAEERLIDHEAEIAALEASSAELARLSSIFITYPQTVFNYLMDKYYAIIDPLHESCLMILLYI